MAKFIESVLLSSDSPRKLAEFYRDLVGLELTTEYEMGEKGEEGFSFEMEGASLNIMHHSKVKGKSSQPERIMFNLEVEDIEKEVKRFKEKKVTLIQDIYHIEDYGYIATFADPDGNYFQLVKTRE